MKYNFAAENFDHKFLNTYFKAEYIDFEKWKGDQNF